MKIHRASRLGWCFGVRDGVRDGLAARGFHPVMVGQRNHVAVRGMAEDHPGCHVLLTEDDTDGMEARERFGVVSQTTQPWRGW